MLKPYEARRAASR